MGMRFLKKFFLRYEVFMKKYFALVQFWGPEIHPYTNVPLKIGQNCNLDSFE